MPITGLLTKPQKETVKLYNGDVILQFSPGAHRYNVTFKGEKIYGTCGVTTVLGVMDKPQLLGWVANMTSDAWLEGLQNADKIDEVLLHRLHKESPLAWRVKRDSAGDIGTLIHSFLEQYINAKINKTDIPVLPTNQIMKDSVLRFISWEEQEGITFTASEQKVYSLKHNIAGTCDFLYITKDGKLGIGDIKTSKGIYDSFYYQVAAYRYMLEEEQRYTADSTPIPYEEMTIVKICKEDGDMEVKKFGHYKEYAKGFLACSVLYRMRNLKG